MRTIEKNIYTFNELSESAKDKALENYQNNNDWFWGDEALNTLKKFADMLNIRVGNYSIDAYGHSYINFSFPYSNNNIDELSNVRLLSYLWNNYKSDLYKGKYYTVKSNKAVKHNRVTSKILRDGKIFNAYYSAITLDNCCPLTGVYFDDDILQPIFEFMDKPDNRTFEELINDCMDSFIESCIADIEYNDSMECFAESCKANNYEFDEYGNMQ